MFRRENVEKTVLHIFLYFNYHVYSNMIFHWLRGFINSFFLIKSILIRSVRPSIFVFPAALWADWLHFFAWHRLQFYCHWRWLQIIQKTFIWFGICMASFVDYQQNPLFTYILSLFWFYNDTLDSMFQSFQ